MMKRFIVLSCLVTSISGFAQPLSRDWIDRQLADAAKQYHYMAEYLPAGVMPRSFAKDTVRTCKSDNWTAGFYPGTCLMLADANKDAFLYKEGQKRTGIMAKEQYSTATHDLGFMMYCSYGILNQYHPSDSAKRVLINSARSLATRFNPTVGCIRSWGRREDSTEFRVIIDNMMNLELLFWAARNSDDPALRQIAITHANTTMRNHFRPDFSSYHVVTYDPRTGNVLRRQTAQGAADSSAWARGQSWGLYGYTLMFRETKDSKYLQQAQSIAAFILSNPNLPADKIPYWDYDAPGIPNTYRDASSAAVMASALLELAGYSKGSLAKKYREAASTMLRTLASPEYSASLGTYGGFLLKHSVAHLPKNTEVDTPLPYADYYYIEALLRYRASLKK